MWSVLEARFDRLAVVVETTDEQVPPVGVVRLWYQLPVRFAMVSVTVVASTLLAVSVATLVGDASTYQGDALGASGPLPFGFTARTL